MATLTEALLNEAKRPSVISDCEKLIDEEVASKSGFTGIAVKGAFAMVKAVKPGIIKESVENLLNDFVGRMEPFYAQYQSASGGKSLSDYFSGRAGEVADALLGVTDDRAKRAKNATMKKAYEGLRPQGKKHVEAAIPRLSRLVEKHLAA